MVDILLTHGYYVYDDVREQAIMKPYPPLGILYLASHLKAQGFDARVFDPTFLGREALRRHIQETRPPVVGLYCTMGTRKNALEIARFCKGQGCIVVAGGPDSANYAEKYLQRGVDVVVVGEGEKTLEGLLPHLARHGATGTEPIAGIVFRTDTDRVVRTPSRGFIRDLNAQPWPDRDAIHMSKYLDVWRERHGMSAVSLITARGCPYTCAWCSHAVFGCTYRHRSALSVADEIEWIHDRYHPDMLWFADDVFTLNRQGVLALAAELERRGLRIPFEATSREDRLDEEMVQTLAKMGCFRLWLGCESGSPRVIAAMDRGVSSERTIRMAHLLQKYGIEVGMFIMLGYEGEEFQDLRQTMDMLQRARPDTYLTTVAYPIKGTPYYERVAERVIARKEWEEGADWDNTVAGRHSRRYYQAAMRWMAGQVAWAKQRHIKPPEKRDYRVLVRAVANAGIGRLGMWLTEGQVEAGQ